MRISRSYDTDDWKRLTFKSKEDWQRAVAIFKDLMEKVIQDYANTLLNPESDDLREAFRRKMNFIARVEEQGPEQIKPGETK
jgi:hypothetical protein